MIPGLRHALSNQRSSTTNWRLGVLLAFIAGAINAGGFFAVGQYTSHMTGMVSAMADNISLGHWQVVVMGMGAVAAFMAGAMSTAWLVHWSLRQGFQAAFGLPLLIEALLLLVFGLFGSAIDAWGRGMVPSTVLLLCFIMGLQNAVITKISRAEIRTTHLTGLLTDLGMELGKLLYINPLPHSLKAPVVANRQRILVHASLVVSFLLGGITGAIGFQRGGYGFTVPLAALLFMLTIRPLWHTFSEHAHTV
jgi:uncharacterized membrane protein YoaK (UPF0700 family)